MKKSKIAIIGAGNVGSTTAYAIMLNDIASEILLVDINETRCIGEVYDLADALSLSHTSSIKKSSLQEAAQADIIIVTAGKNQKTGQDRTELLTFNKQVITDIFTKLKPHKDAIVIIVSNPVDVLTYHAQQFSDLPHTQIIGSGTYLDTLRLRGYIAQKVGIAEQSVQAYILGEHGDTQFPAWSSAHVAGIPIGNFKELDDKALDNIAQETRTKAYEIIQCKGATFFGIAACVADICENILFNQKRVMPLSVFLEKFGVCLSLPVVLGAHGVEQILHVPLDAHEQKQLEQSASALKKLL